EAGEDTTEGRRLHQHEDVLEGRVAAREVEAGDVADGREPAGEGGEEEEREDQRWDQQRFVGEEVVDAAPGDCAGDGAEACRGAAVGGAHVRTSRVFRALDAPSIPIANRASAMPKPSR